MADRSLSSTARRTEAVAAATTPSYATRGVGILTDGSELIRRHVDQPHFPRSAIVIGNRRLILPRCIIRPATDGSQNATV